MKSTLAILTAVCFTVLFTTSAHAAKSKGAALNECKRHLDELYQNDVRSKVKRIKKRGSGLEVKLKVSAQGERFNAVCAFADGNMVYTTDRPSSLIAD